ncbi:MAG TPA: ABC transporter ATP-binding protein [Pirellulales bacterium]|jgi:ABC-2 type transport system ATP-binding protein
MVSSTAVSVSRLVYRYGERKALDDVSLEIAPGEIFAFLGPNGGGKTTLFRLLSTLVPIQEGSITILGLDVAQQSHEVRRRIGVVFQAPSLDRKLTVNENLWQHGQLYGITGRTFDERRREMLARFGLADREHDLVETLSGGLRRRVELAKGLLHQPRVLLLDEPSTGLDPGARSDLWEYLHRVRNEEGVTVVLTTHLLEEAEKADRLAIMSAGSLVALDTPDQLRGTVGGDTIWIETAQPDSLAAAITQRLGCAATVVDGRVRLEQAAGHQWVARLVEEFPGQVSSITVGKPTLEDVFIARTGHRFWQAEEVGVG